MKRSVSSLFVGLLILGSLPVGAKTVYIRDGVTDWTSAASYYGGEAPAEGDVVVVSKLILNSSVTVKALALDASGTGSCSGAAFAATGVLTVSGELQHGEMTLGTRFDNCTGLANLENWTAVRNGKTLHRRITVVDNQIHLVPVGMKIIIR